MNGKILSPTGITNMKAKPYRLLFFSAVLATLMTAPQNSPAAGPNDRPNLIFVLTDDQRFDTLGCTGNPFIRTPNLDQLAAEGVLFANASVNSAICTPSRACYFLGQYERRHGINFNSGTAMAPEAWADSYPVQLRNAGYFTGYVGKNHVPIGAEAYDTGLIDESFDFWYAGHGHIWFYPKRRHDIFEHASADTQIEIIKEGTESFLNTEEDFIQGARSFLKNRPTDVPFSLSLAFNLPHGAGTSTMEMLDSDPELYRTAYRDHMDEIPLPETYVARDNIDTPKLPPDVLHAEYRQKGYDYVDSPDTLRERVVRETQTVTGIDRVVGAIRAILEKEGIAENTIIIFSSDHGKMHGEFGLGGKALNYEACLRVPMIVYDPRLPESVRGRRSTALVESVDIAPTLLDYAAVERPATMQGLSLRPLIEGSSEKLRDYSFAENLWSTIFGNPRIESVKSAEWKYIRYFENDRARFADLPWEDRYKVSPNQLAEYESWLTASIQGEQPVYEELFHLASDPGETTNLADRSVYAEVLDEMRSRCQELVTMAKGDADTPPASIVVAGIKDSATKKEPEKISIPTND